MSHSIRRLYRFFRGIFSVAASSLAGLGRRICNSSNNTSNANPDSYPFEHKIDSGGGRAAGFPDADRALRHWCGDDRGLWTSRRGHDFPIYVVGHAWCGAAVDAYRGLILCFCNVYGYVFGDCRRPDGERAGFAFGSGGGAQADFSLSVSRRP